MVFILWLIYQFSAHHGQPSHNSNYAEDHQLSNKEIKWNPPIFLEDFEQKCGWWKSLSLVNACFNVIMAYLAILLEQIGFFRHQDNNFCLDFLLRASWTLWVGGWYPLLSSKSQNKSL